MSVLPLRFEVRDIRAEASPWHRAAAVALGLVAAGLFLSTQPSLTGGLVSTVWNTTLGSDLGTTQMLDVATGLILAGCSFAVCYRARLWNIGIDGQLLMGVWAATGVAFSLPDLATVWLVPLMILAAMAAGMAWILGPALLKAYLGISEIITTLMLNFVAFLWLAYWVTGPWEEPVSSFALGSRPVPERTWFPDISLGSVTFGLGLIVAIAAAMLLWLVFRYTRYGYRTTLVGANPETAQYAGVGLRAHTMSVMLLSGAIAGLLGVVLELNLVHRYSTELSANTGFSGIIVAVLAGGSFLGLVFTGALMGFVTAAGNGLKIAGVAGNVVVLVVGLLLLFAALADVLARYRIRWGRRPTIAEPPSPPGGKGGVDVGAPTLEPRALEVQNLERT